jgi:hypothetical protein
LLQENLGFKSIIDDVEDAKRTDLHPFHHQARKLETVSKELDEVKSKFITASGEVTDLSQRLAAAAGKGTTVQNQSNLQLTVLFSFQWRCHCPQGESRPAEIHWRA